MAEEISVVLKGRDETLGQVLSGAEKDFGGVAQAAQKLSKESDNLDDSMKKTEKSASGLGKALGNVSQIAGGFIVAQGLMKAPGFLMDAAKAASEEEAAMIRLTQTLENYTKATGGGAVETQKLLVDMEKRIAAGQKLAFTDDDVRDSMQFLINATGDYNEAVRRQAAAMDLARGANIPLTTATKMLGKMNQENVDTFKKLGIEMREGATEAEALAAVQAKFSGQADKFAKSGAGQMAIFQIRMAEAKETLGGVLLPVLITTGEVLNNQVVPAVEKFVNAVGPGVAAAVVVITPFLQFLANNLDIIGPMIGSVAAVIMASMVPAAYAWAAAEAVKTVALLASAAAFVVANAPIILAAAAVALLVGGVLLLIKHWDEITEKVPILGKALDFVKNAFFSVKGAVEETIAFIQRHWDTLEKIIIAPFLPLLVTAAIMFGVTTVLINGVKETIEFVQKHWDTIERIIEAPFLPLIIPAKALFGVRGAIFEGISDAVGFVSDGVKQIIGFISGVASAIDKFTQPIQDAAAKIGGAIVDGIKKGLSGLAQVFAPIGGEIMEVIRGAVNNAMAWLHDNIKIEIPGFDPPGPGPSVPGFSWHFPLLQFGQGGFVPGVGRSDSVPALLTPGEFVLTRQQTQSLMANRAISAISGGGRAGNVYHVNVTMPNYLGSKTDVAREIMRELRRGGLDVA